jgi:hypothetical protein
MPSVVEWSLGNVEGLGPSRNRLFAAGRVRLTSLAVPASLSASIALIATFGLSRVFEPHAGDDALFMLAARMMDAGLLLYRDFIDVKQPGIFYFYFVAGKLFGFDEVGLHLFELLYSLVGSLCMVAAVWTLLSHRWLSIVLTTLFLGAYYAQTHPWTTTQVEVLVALPLFVYACLLLRFAETGHRWRSAWLGVAGLVAAGVVAFKAAFGIVLLGITLAALTPPIQRQLSASQKMRHVVDALTPVAFAFVAAVTAMAFWLWSDGTLVAFLEATVFAPREIMLDGRLPPVSRLLTSFGIYAACVAAWLPLAFCNILRTRSDLTTGLVGTMLAWIAFGALAIVVQRFSWWPYHLQLIVLPVLVLAITGLDSLLDRLGRTYGFGERAKVAACLLIVLPVLGAYLPVTAERLQLAARELIGKGVTRDAYYRSIDPKYGLLSDSAEAIRPSLGTESVYVLGNPTTYLLLNKLQPLPQNGWSPELLSVAQWSALAESLETTLPDFVFVEHEYGPILSLKGGRVLAVLGSHYDTVQPTTLGTWYRSQAR